MKKILLLFFHLSIFPFLSASENNQREIWINHCVRIAEPVLKNLANDSLRVKMPILGTDRDQYQYLEALGRVVCGIAPWLDLIPDSTMEGKKRDVYFDLTVKALTVAFSPATMDSESFLRINGNQPLVDAAYLAQGLIRSPRIWHSLNTDVQKNIILRFKELRAIKAPNSNWLLFASMIEAFMLKYGQDIVDNRLFKGVNYFYYGWYLGDGIYKDGRSFSVDYYNSFVIHPMLTDILKVIVNSEMSNENWNSVYVSQLRRYSRFAEIQERTITPDGYYPVIGRTMICRIGAFHALADAALLHSLPKHVTPAQVRCAMSQVLHNQFSTNTNFSADGFMTIGFMGRQDSIAESYVSLGSSYHAMTFFLPLGLPETDAFWNSPDELWTSAKIWSGQEIRKDHAFSEENNLDFLIELYYSYKSLSYKRQLLYGVIFITFVCLVFCFGYVVGYKLVRLSK